MPGLLDPTNLVHNPDYLLQTMQGGRAAMLPHVQGLLNPGGFGGALPATAISTRFPTAVGREADPIATPMMSGDLPKYLGTPVAATNMELMAQYPGMGFLKGMPTAEAAHAAIRRLSDNMVHIYERSPKIMQRVSPQWYDGGKRMVSAWAERYGIPPQAVAASMAALSPQKDWFMNVSLAERVADTMFNKASTPFSSAMNAKGKEIYSSPANKPIFERIKGKTLSQLTDPLDKAAWIRLHDEAHNPRDYRAVSPDGGLGPHMQNEDGSRAKVAWGSLDQVQKAVRAIESGGDMTKISPLLGTRHKVRNFYNNLLHPEQSIGSTVDTHQVAGGLMSPLAGGDTAVMHNLKTGPLMGKKPPGYVGAAGSNVTGFQGTYPIFEAATKMTGDRLGLLQHKAQSATWEPVRTLFSNKTASLKEKANAIWSAVDRGLLTPARARDEIMSAAGGIKLPDWTKGGLLYDPRHVRTY